MLYFFYGTDQKKIQEQSSAIVDALKKRREFAQVFYIHADTFTKEDIEALQSTNGIFFDKHVFVYRGMLAANKDIREYVLASIPSYLESPHVHIFIEEEMEREDLDKLKKYTDIKIKHYSMPFVPAKEDSSRKLFALVSTIAQIKSLEAEQRTSAKKIGVWKVFDEVRKTGMAPEELFGILWWRYRSIGQARGATQKESGLAPYAFSEAKKIADTYEKRKDKAAFKRDMSLLLNLYQDAHNGEGELWEGLEAWVLA
ncbi:MAG: hypothetical protein RJB39_629 [Candidatus Parcubacteria bacterium]|jgi:hypothetical protein